MHDWKNSYTDPDLSRRNQQLSVAVYVTHFVVHREGREGRQD